MSGSTCTGITVCCSEVTETRPWFGTTLQQVSFAIVRLHLPYLILRLGFRLGEVGVDENAGTNSHVITLPE